MTNFFLDTSVLFKLFVREELSEQYLSLLKEDPSVHVSHISWVEFHSALRRRMDLKELTFAQRNEALQRFKRDWNSYSKIRVEEAVLESAARLVTAHSLKTLDSIQLASALELSAQLEEPLMFLTADLTLQAAARREKLRTQI